MSHLLAIVGRVFSFWHSKPINGNAIILIEQELQDILVCLGHSYTHSLFQYEWNL